MEEQKSIIICCNELQPKDTKIVINNKPVPRQMIYGVEHGFDPAPGSRDMFSIVWSYKEIPDWQLGDSFYIVNSNETQEVSNYGSGFETEF